jgi:alkaline phosphatase D
LAQAANRSFQFGDLVSLHMVETRLTARTRQLSYERDLTFKPGPDGAPAPDVAAFRARLQSPERRLLGEGQLEWLEEELKASVARGSAWQLIGNQIVMARVNGPDLDRAFGREAVLARMSRLPDPARAAAQRTRALFSQGLPLNLDAWDGYPAERERLYAVLRQAGARPIVLAGDSHAFWANELADASGTRVAVEFGATSITSPPPGLDSRIPGVRFTTVVTAQNPDVVYCDESRRGFVLLTLTPEAARGELVAVSTIESREFATEVLKTFVVRPDGQGVGPLAEA